MVAGLTGCGSSGSGSADATGGALHVVQAADVSTMHAKSARISLAERISVAGHQVNVTGRGEENFTTRALDLSIGTAKESTEIRRVGTAAYVKLPAAVAAHLPGGKTWLSLDLSSTSAHGLGASFGQLQQANQSDPATVLGYLKAASANGLHKAGTATIRGVRTTEYDASIDLTKVAAAQPATARPAITRLVKALGTSTYPMKVWLDGSGLIRQLSFQLSASPDASQSGASPSSSPALHVGVTATVQLYDFGVPVHVSAPPASQRLDISTLLGKAGSGLGKQLAGSSRT
jgi:hypothetical protein